MPGFTPLYDWVMAEPDLTHYEALIVCRVLRWGKNGCWESNAKLGKALKMDPRTIQRTVKSLVIKEWLWVFYPKRHIREMHIEEKRLAAGPLFREIGVATMKKKIVTAQSHRARKNV